MPLYLIRHGQTEFNVAGRYQGQNDSPLTRTGKEQARRNGEVLRDLLTDRTGLKIIASPLGRTMATAEIICKAMGLPASDIETDELVVEMHYGDWQGMSRDEIEHEYPGEWEKRMANLADYSIPGGGESYNAIFRRVNVWLEKTQAAWDTDTPWIVVSHGGTSSIIRGRYANLNVNQTRDLDRPQDRFYALCGGDITSH